MGAGTGPRHDGPMLQTSALRLQTWWHRDELDEQLVDPVAVAQPELSRVA